jgi:hypothetical protein
MKLSDYLAPLADERTTVSDVEDADLETGLFALMGRLEQTLQRLESGGDPARRHAAVDCGKEMLVELLDFAETQFPPEAVDELLARAGDLHDATKQFDRMVKHSWSGFAGFFGLKVAAAEGADEAYTRLGRDFRDLFADCFAKFVARFHAADKAQEWQSSCDVFLGDLSRKW